MKLKTEHIIIGGALLAIVLYRSAKDRIIDKLVSFVPGIEKFSATPYWDVNRYSWGYGTAAPGATGTITKEQALADMIAYLMADYATLSNKITRSLTASQWAALLSFSYNLGIGNAYNLVPLINAGNDAALKEKWQKYVYAGGVVNQGLVSRRNKEIALWFS